MEEENDIYGLRQPRTGRGQGDNGFLGDSSFQDVLGGVAKYGIPLAAILRSSAQASKLRDRTDLNLETPELMTGRVRALRRPNFNMRRRDPAGSSLAEYMAGQHFNDASQQDQINNFNIADEQSRIGQENQIADRTNQNIMARTQIHNQQKFFRGQVGAQELLGNNIPFQQEALLGLYHNVQSDLSQNAYVNASTKSQSASAILTSPNSTEEDRNWARQYIMGGLPRKSKGGRLRAKSKFYAGPC